MNDFDTFEKEEAAKRAASYDAKKLKAKSIAEQAKHDAGIGVEDGSEEFEDDEE